MSLTHAKFKPNGEFNLFKGNTVVANLYNQPHILEVVETLQTAYRELPFIHKFTLTPPQSIHMTVIELVCDQNRKEEYWSTDLPLDMPIEEVNRYFGDKLTSFPLCDETIEMKVTGMGRQNILLSPANETSRARLNTIRDYVARVTGVKFPNHYNYQFHITIGYIREELSEEEQLLFQSFLERMSDYVIQYLPAVSIDRIDYTTFESMASFVPYKK